jgi:hypothetical protein
LTQDEKIQEKKLPANREQCEPLGTLPGGSPRVLEKKIYVKFFPRRRLVLLILIKN